MVPSTAAVVRNPRSRPSLEKAHRILGAHRNRPRDDDEPRSSLRTPAEVRITCPRGLDTVKTHDEIVAWLEEDDARSRPYRAERLRFVLQYLDSETMTEFYGGEMAFLAFEEARRAFVHGLFVACTVLTQVCVEHTLGGVFR